MNSVLYEIAFEPDIMFFIPVFMCIAFLVFPKIWKKQQKGKYTMKAYKMIKIFCGVCFSFAFVMSILTCISMASLYEKTVVAYKNGDYETVEGYVENFIPMPYDGHSVESFEINGVGFSYSDYHIGIGYNNTKSHGGVITGNGQHLKIGYVIDSDTNIIVYIEQLDNK